MVSEIANLRWLCSPGLPAGPGLVAAAHPAFGSVGHVPCPAPRASGPAPARAPARATAPCCYWLPSPDLLACVKERGEEFNQHLEIICSSTRQSCDASFLQCSLASWLGKRGLAVARTWLTVAAGG